ncbi:unnamed protein product [Dibothriocephalus latus]|uniref:Phosphatidic acid phosphatase type 2/haloperoxidase domain-containing protein n=1 Tax=Dibothriocephalus latus TaxID=60516 RepID=A0A3P6PIL7_DIBLA|nr:unnamed protein product [Dibothriocephalus latus]
MLPEIFTFAFVASVSIGISYLEPFHRGFFLNDTSLSYPYRPSTVPTLVLGSVAPSVAVVTILILELLRGKLYGFSRRFRGTFAVGFCVYKYVYTLALGFSITGVLVNVGKVATGRLRPHFFAVCQPKTAIAPPEVYITEYICGGTNKKHMEDMRYAFQMWFALEFRIYFC